jgi:ribosomal protein L37AE/L43A
MAMTAPVLATRVMKARWPGTCPACRRPIRVGDQIAKCGIWLCIQCAISYQHDSPEAGQ